MKNIVDIGIDAEVKLRKDKNMQKVKVVSKAELARIEDGSGVIISTAGRLVISNVKQEDYAYDCLKKIKTQLDLIEKKRTAITGPLNQSLTEANALFKPLSTPLKAAKKIINDKILEFKLAGEEKADAEMKRREKIQESHKAKGHKTTELVPVIAETGKSTMQKRWTYDMTDIKKVPAEYLQLNLGAIQKAINAGERKISGLKIYQKSSLSIR